MQFVPRRPDPQVAKAELRRNLTVFGAAVVAVRAIPYVLNLFQSKA